MNGISTTLQLLQRHFKKRKDSVAIATLEELQKETRRLDSLLQEFRSFSRATKLNRGKIDLREITREVLNTGTRWT